METLLSGGGRKGRGTEDSSTSSMDTVDEEDSRLQSVTRLRKEMSLITEDLLKGGKRG